MKKIAFLLNSIFTFGGEQRVACILANSLVDNFDVTIFTEDSPEITDNPYNLSSKVQVKYFSPFKANLLEKLIRALLKLPVIKYLRNFGWTWKLSHYNNHLSKRLKTLIGNDFDTVIALSERLSVLLGFAKKMGLNSKVIVWEHNSYECYFKTPYDCLWKQEKLFIEAAKYFDNCVVLNEDYSDKYRKYLGVSSCVIYNPRSFVSKEKSKLENKIIICCCRLSIRTKGLDLLIDAFENFSKQNSDWELHIVGEGKDRKKIEQLIQKKNLKQRVKLLGYRSDVKEQLLNASIFVLPSRWEGFPMSLTEAYECGLPSVFFDIPATIPFRNNNSALTAKSFDTKDFSEKMLLLTKNSSLRKEMGANAADFAEELSVELFEKKWIDILNK